MVQVKFYDKVNDNLLKFAVIVSKSNEKWVFCKHKHRDTYECPGGQRDDGEDIVTTAKMEGSKMNVSVDISNVIIETKRLIIRPWKNEDLNDFYEYASVDGVGQMAGWNPHKSKEESQEILKLFIEDRNIFALELKANRKVIGSIGLEEIGIDLGELYTSLIGREIGYVLSKEYWGQGLMPEAVMSVMDYCYKDLNCEFLQCSHAVGNEQSKRVIEKVSFRYVQDYERTGINGNTRKSKVYVKESILESSCTRM